MVCLLEWYLVETRAVVSYLLSTTSAKTSNRVLQFEDGACTICHFCQKKLVDDPR